MNFLISGGTGFIGSALCSFLLDKGHSIVVKTRYPEGLHRGMRGVKSLDQLGSEEKFDVIINLAGEPIADKRWSKNQKQEILRSRIDTTQEFIRFLENSTNKPALFISSSAIGYYGIGISDEAVTEDSPGDDSFSSRLCAQWEECALQAVSLGVRTCLLRTGIVLGKDGGALNKMLLPFKLGLGGKIGSGKQWMPWIYLNDMISIIDFCIEHEQLQGPINCTAPNPVTNAVFTEALAKTLRRPAIFNLPERVIKIMMGEMGQELLLSGKKVLPSKLEKTGFKFKLKTIQGTLAEILQS